MEPVIFKPVGGFSAFAKAKNSLIPSKGWKIREKKKKRLANNIRKSPNTFSCPKELCVSKYHSRQMLF